MSPSSSEYAAMCLAIPMQLKRIDGLRAICEAKGVERDVSLFMLQDEPLAPGDFVLVHVGYALQRVTAEEAHSTWELLDEVLEFHA
ncbi:MAG TPA: HypC/HybG/HupF family hydrogenase formation chaperone [Povalibacter sp.]